MLRGGSESGGQRESSDWSVCRCSAGRVRCSRTAAEYSRCAVECNSVLRPDNRELSFGLDRTDGSAGLLSDCDGCNGYARNSGWLVRLDQSGRQAPHAYDHAQSHVLLPVIRPNWFDAEEAVGSCDCIDERASAFDLWDDIRVVRCIDRERVGSHSSSSPVPGV
jgi:hypothetical protein